MAQPRIPAALVLDELPQPVDERPEPVWVVDVKSHRVIRQKPAAPTLQPHT